MTTTKKVFSLIAVAFLAIFFIALLADHQLTKTILPFTLLRPRNYPVIGQYLAQFIFWGSLVILAILLISFLVISFWPTDRKTYLLKKGDSKLEIDRKAIDSFIEHVTDKTHWLTNTSVKSKLKRRKIKVNIKSTLRPVDNAKQKTEVLINDLKNELAQLLGLSDTKDIEISLEDFKPRQKSKTPRVV